jgi:hypothetical protein
VKSLFACLAQQATWLPKKEQGITNVHETEAFSLHRRSHRRLARRKIQIKKGRDLIPAFSAPCVY